MDNAENLSEEEKLKAENDFLKMKIMLEHGADFYQPDRQDVILNPEAEHAFLNHIIEFEKQFELRKTINVYDKIGRPGQFKPVSVIPADAIEEEWSKLLEYMQQYGVDLSACSPKVTARALYRFTTEELFKHEMGDMDIPGMMSCFIYDEFHPDYEYDNTRYAVDDCIRPILSNEPLEFTPWYAKDDICLNDYAGITEESVKEIVNAFKKKYADIELREISNISCKLQETSCRITGTQETVLTFDNGHTHVIGNWLVEFAGDGGYWNIVNVQIENVDL